MKVPNLHFMELLRMVSLSRLQNEGSQLSDVALYSSPKSIKATE